MPEPIQTPVFDFMLVRPPAVTPADIARRNYIRDAVLPGKGGLADVPLQSSRSPSAIARVIFHKVFCESPTPGEVVSKTSIREAMLAFLKPMRALCEEDPPPERVSRGSGAPITTDAAAAESLAPDATTATAGPEDATIAPWTSDSTGSNDPLPLDISDLQRHAYLRIDDTFYLLPDTPTGAGAPLAWTFDALERLFRKGTRDFSEEDLFTEIRKIFGNVSASAMVFKGPTYTEAFTASKRALFDALYLAYIMRRWVEVNMEPLMAGLRVLHALEALAIDEIYFRAIASTLSESERNTLSVLEGDFPALVRWDRTSPLTGFPLVESWDELATYLDARPVVHPIFAQLYYFGRPFNSIKPLGVGDLKVVKQTLVVYQAGEIADIQNVMKGESRIRKHRRLEREEDSTSSTTTSQQETSRDTQSTDRFEIKREAENIVKTDLNVTANMRAQYDNKPVLLAVGAGFAYSRSASDQLKLAQNYSREIVDKAVSRVQTTTVQQRMTTQIFETKEINSHTFVNIDPASKHVSGIYQWVDKLYKAQVYNYGKRMMFEFVLPEPASFLVDSRLHAFEATLDVPLKPIAPEPISAAPDFAPNAITRTKFDELRSKFDLSAFSYPPATKTIAFVAREQGADNGFFSSHGIDDQNRLFARSYTCDTGSKGYRILRLRLSGLVQFKDKIDPNGPPPNATEINYIKLGIDGTTLWYEEHSNIIYDWYRDDTVLDLQTPYLLTADDVTLLLGVQDAENYDLTLGADLALDDGALLDWQVGVWTSIATALKRQADAVNSANQSVYQSKLAAYENRLGEIRSTAMNDLIQGQSSQYNQELIMTELRRQCLAMFTKEFDADASDDVLTDLESMGTRTTNVSYRHLEIDDTGDQLVVEFRPRERETLLPVPKLDTAREKGRYIQFLEQAFEWSRLGYICYPYFWATPPKWVELMNRSDDADANLTAFLRAGAVKVLVAVSPSYDEAVLHYLATREPWQGGPSPVIGDPLYMPLFEELRRQQDDLLGATPEGDAWEFVLPTSLVYLRGSTTELPPRIADQ